MRDQHRSNHYGRQAVFLVNGNQADSILGAAEELLERVREHLDRVEFSCLCGIGADGSGVLDIAFERSAMGCSSN